MTEMFDASMQAIRTHRWNFNVPTPIPSLRISTTPRTEYTHNYSIRIYDFAESSYCPIESSTEFLNFGLLWYGKARPLMARSAAQSEGYDIADFREVIGEQPVLEESVVTELSSARKEVVVENGKATAIVFKKCTRVYDENNKFSPLYDENETITIPADKVIFAIGQSIIWGNLLDGSNVELGRGNGPVADGYTFQTSQEDIFTGGDVLTGPKFAIDAIAQGHEAAESLHRYVQNGHMTIGRDPRRFIQFDTSDIKVENYATILHVKKQQMVLKNHSVMSMEHLQKNKLRRKHLVALVVVQLLSMITVVSVAAYVQQDVNLMLLLSIVIIQKQVQW